MENMHELTLLSGSIIKVGGMPFQLAEDTQVWGRRENVKLAEEASEGRAQFADSADSPAQP